jgi:hypothetical protein
MIQRSRDRESSSESTKTKQTYNEENCNHHYEYEKYQIDNCLVEIVVPDSPQLNNLVPSTENVFLCY